MSRYHYHPHAPGPYEKIIRKASLAMSGNPGDELYDQVIVHMLSVLVIVASEHNLSLAVRTIRNPKPVPLDADRPGESPIDQAVKALIYRDEFRDEATARVLSLLTDLIRDVDLERLIKAIGDKPSRRAA